MLAFITTSEILWEKSWKSVYSMWQDNYKLHIDASLLKRLSTGFLKCFEIPGAGLFACLFLFLCPLKTAFWKKCCKLQGAVGFNLDWGPMFWEGRLLCLPVPGSTGGPWSGSQRTRQGSQSLPVGGSEARMWLQEAAESRNVLLPRGQICWTSVVITLLWHH